MRTFARRLLRRHNTLFTMIEILIACMVIGILFSMLLPSLDEYACEMAAADAARQEAEAAAYQAEERSRHDAAARAVAEERARQNAMARAVAEERARLLEAELARLRMGTTDPG